MFRRSRLFSGRRVAVSSVPGDSPLRVRSVRLSCLRWHCSIGIYPLHPRFQPILGDFTRFSRQYLRLSRSISLIRIFSRFFWFSANKEFSRRQKCWAFIPFPVNLPLLASLLRSTGFLCLPSVSIFPTKFAIVGDSGGLFRAFLVSGTVL